MDQTALDKCQELIGYQFNDVGLLSTALTHSSVASTRLESNERMEFLGDAVLGLTVCEWLYRTQSDLLEGQMTRIKSLVVSRQVCAVIAEKSGISSLLLLGKGMPESDALPQSVSAAVFEAIIGAIFLDGGLEEARRFVLDSVMAKLTEALEKDHMYNYKSLLQQWSQRRWGTTPEYQLLDEKGPDHDKCFEVAVAIEGKYYPSAWGRTKKEAEQEAARRTLIELDLIKDH